MFHFDNKENNAQAQDGTSPKSTGEQPQPKVRRSVLKEFDPLASDSPLPPKTRPIRLDEEEDEDLFEDAESSLPIFVCPVNKSLSTTPSRPNIYNRESILIPGLIDYQPNQSPALNDTNELSFLECVENVSQIDSSPLNNTTFSDDIEFNYNHSAKNISFENSSRDNTSVNTDIVSRSGSENRVSELNDTFESIKRIDSNVEVSGLTNMSNSQSTEECAKGLIGSPGNNTIQDISANNSVNRDFGERETCHESLVKDEKSETAIRKGAYVDNLNQPSIATTEGLNSQLNDTFECPQTVVDSIQVNQMSDLFLGLSVTGDKTDTVKIQQDAEANSVNEDGDNNMLVRITTQPEESGQNAETNTFVLEEPGDVVQSDSRYSHSDVKRENDVKDVEEDIERAPLEQSTPSSQLEDQQHSENGLEKKTENESPKHTSLEDPKNTGELFTKDSSPPQLINNGLAKDIDHINVMEESKQLSKENLSEIIQVETTQNSPMENDLSVVAAIESETLVETTNAENQLKATSETVAKNIAHNNVMEKSMSNSPARANQQFTEGTFSEIIKVEPTQTIPVERVFDPPVIAAIGNKVVDEITNDKDQVKTTPETVANESVNQNEESNSAAVKAVPQPIPGEEEENNSAITKVLINNIQVDENFAESKTISTSYGSVEDDAASSSVHNKTVTEEGSNLSLIIGESKSQSDNTVGNCCIEMETKTISVKQKVIDIDSSNATDVIIMVEGNLNPNSHEVSQVAHTSAKYVEAIGTTNQNIAFSTEDLPIPVENTPQVSEEIHIDSVTFKGNSNTTEKTVSKSEQTAEIDSVENNEERHVDLESSSDVVQNNTSNPPVFQANFEESSPDSQTFTEIRGDTNTGAFEKVMVLESVEDQVAFNEHQPTNGQNKLSCLDVQDDQKYNESRIVEKKTEEKIPIEISQAEQEQHIGDSLGNETGKGTFESFENPIECREVVHRDRDLSNKSDLPVLLQIEEIQANSKESPPHCQSLADIRGDPTIEASEELMVLESLVDKVASNEHQPRNDQNKLPSPEIQDSQQCNESRTVEEKTEETIQIEIPQAEPKQHIEHSLDNETENDTSESSGNPVVCRKVAYEDMSFTQTEQNVTDALAKSNADQQVRDENSSNIINNQSVSLNNTFDVPAVVTSAISIGPLVETINDNEQLNTTLESTTTYSVDKNEHLVTIEVEEVSQSIDTERRRSGVDSITLQGLTDILSVELNSEEAESKDQDNSGSTVEDVVLSSVCNEKSTEEELDKNQIIERTSMEGSSSITEADSGPQKIVQGSPDDKTNKKTVDNTQVETGFIQSAQPSEKRDEAHAEIVECSKLNGSSSVTEADPGSGKLCQDSPIDEPNQGVSTHKTDEPYVRTPFENAAKTPVDIKQVKTGFIQSDPSSEKPNQAYEEAAVKEAGPGSQKLSQDLPTDEPNQGAFVQKTDEPYVPTSFQKAAAPFDNRQVETSFVQSDPSSEKPNQAYEETANEVVKCSKPDGSLSVTEVNSDSEKLSQELPTDEPNQGAIIHKTEEPSVPTSLEETAAPFRNKQIEANSVQCDLSSEKPNQAYEETADEVVECRKLGSRSSATEADPGLQKSSQDLLADKPNQDAFVHKTDGPYVPEPSENTAKTPVDNKQVQAGFVQSDPSSEKPNQACEKTANEVVECRKLDSRSSATEADSGLQKSSQDLLADKTNQDSFVHKTDEPYNPEPFENTAKTPVDNKQAETGFIQSDTSSENLNKTYPQTANKVVECSKLDGSSSVTEAQQDLLTDKPNQAAFVHKPNEPYDPTPFKNNATTQIYNKQVQTGFVQSDQSPENPSQTDAETANEVVECTKLEPYNSQEENHNKRMSIEQTGAVNKTSSDLEEDADESEKAVEALARSLNQTIDVEESAIVADIDSSDTSNEGGLNDTIVIDNIESDKKPELTEKGIESHTSVGAELSERLPPPKRIECRPNIRSLRNKTQVISNPLLLKSDHEIIENRKQNSPESDQHFTKEIMRLQNELENLKKELAQTDKCISEEALNQEKHKAAITSYKKIRKQYEEMWLRNDRYLCILRNQVERDCRDLASMELALSDVVEKYERAKDVVEDYRKNEAVWLSNIEAAEQSLAKLNESLVQIKKQEDEKIKRAREKIEEERKAHQQDISKLKGMVKLLKIKTSSLEAQLKQKDEECQALAALREQLTSDTSL